MVEGAVFNDSLIAFAAMSGLSKLLPDNLGRLATTEKC
jgi:hypothetical protein